MREYEVGIKGAAHNQCNLQGYDSHLFIKQLAKIKGDLSCIPSTEEKYIPFSKTIKVGEYK